MPNNIDGKNIIEFLKVAMLGRSYQTDFEYDKLSHGDKNNLLLNVSLFGKKYRRVLSDDEKIDLAINRVYLDFCRTIRKDKGNRQKATTDGEKEISEKIKSIDKQYETWFNDLCKTLTNTIGYTFGQAQKMQLLC